MKLKTIFVLAAMLMLLLPARAQNNNHIPGTLACWGDQVISYAAPGTKFIKIAAGGYHDLGLKSDGTVVAWGDNSSGESTVPVGINGVVSIAAGTSHSLALKSNGAVVAWGDNSYGQSTVPTNLTGVISIAAGAYHSLALKAGGTVVAWGANTTDQGTIWTGQSSVPANATNIVAIAAGDSSSLALKSDGTVVSWGASGVFNGVNGVIAIAAGHTHFLALKSDGTVVASGTQYAGYYTSPVPATVPTNLTGVVAIAAGDDFSLALKSDGTVVMWGENYIGVSQVPVGLNGVTAIAASFYHSLALKNDGTIGAWGYYSYNGWNYYFENPVGIMVPAGLNSVVAIAAGLDGDHNLALNSDGTVVAWGGNYYGESTIPAGLSNVVAIASGGGRSLVAKSDGTVAEWGDMNSLPWLTYAPPGLNNVVAVSAGGDFSMALKADGTIVAWGYSDNGELNVPSDLVGFTAIAAGEDHGMALKSNGTVTAWGNNGDGETNVPANLAGVVAIAAGAYHNLALKADGTVVAWGDNSSGQTNVPANLTNVIAVAAGESYSLAIKKDGTVVGWGTNSYNANTAPTGLNGAISISGGDQFSLALIGPSNQSLAILSQPYGQTIQAGSNVSFTVTASGWPSPNFQWQFNSQNIANATNATLTLNSVTASNDGGYSVVVWNAYGSVTSATASLAVLTDGANGNTPAQITPSTIPSKPSGAKNLVFVTHGWQWILLNPTGPPAQPWMVQMTNAIVQQLGSSSIWQVEAYYWLSDAWTWLPDDALNNAKILGTQIGIQIAAVGYQHVHLIAHSAGSALIQAAADAIRQNSPSTIIQSTFLDPYVGLDGRGINWYGQNADWSDNYFAQDSETGAFTEGQLNHSYNVDVGWLYPNPSNPDPKIVTYADGLFGQVAFATHDWPHDFYTDTVLNTLSASCAAGYGFPLSEEGGNWSSTAADAEGQTPNVLCGSPSAIQNPFPLQTSPIILIDGLENAYNAGANLVGSAGFVLNSIWSALPLVQSAGVHPLGGPVPLGGSSGTNTPAWLAMGVTVTNAANFVQFDAAFTDANTAQGLLTVYWNTNQIGMVDERVAATNLQTYRFILPSTVSSGLYTLSFRLDSFANSSSVAVTNVATGFVGVTQPITLGILITNGAPLLQLTGPAGYSYLVQTSTNLVDWTPTVLLANTNGTASFIDSSAATSGQRFYRAELFSVIAASPTLQAQVSGNSIVITWPASAQNFNLQTTANLADPNSWITLTNVPAIVNSLNTITNPVSSGAQFYRLKQ
jgi:alpha-tubulin suppressor-like RCC1 family protein